MDGQSTPGATTAGTTQAILLIRVLAALSLLPLLVPALSLLGPRAIVPPGGGWTTLWPVVLALGATLYIVYWLRTWPARPATEVAAILIGMAALATLDQAWSPLITGDLWFYVAAVAGAALRARWATLIVFLMAVVLIGALLLTSFHSAPVYSTRVSSPTVVTQAPVFTDRLIPFATSTAELLLGVLVGALVTFLVRINAELRDARTMAARLAVEEERTRMARDLHDLLGQNLSLIGVKLDLARRLIGEPANPAAEEILEAQRMARDALRDVREAVGGYRQPTLEGELAGARVALQAAGIVLELAADPAVLTPATDATCAWVVREGVTNVMRHSRASSCQIDIGHRGGRLIICVTDDGIGGQPNGAGMGLRGVYERVTALGGTLTSGPARSGKGFQLVARLPVDAPEPEDGAN
jgi:two-component system sensor histidine kinase DesK